MSEIEIPQMYINDFKCSTSTLDTLDVSKFTSNSKIFCTINCDERRMFNFDQIQSKTSYAKYHREEYIKNVNR